MSKKKIIFWVTIILVIVGVVFYVHYVNPLATFINVIVFGVGTIVGWIARIIYYKYFNKN